PRWRHRAVRDRHRRCVGGRGQGGDAPRAARRRRRRRDARHRRQLRRKARRVSLPADRVARPPVTLTLTLRSQPPRRVDAAPLVPVHRSGFDTGEVAAVTLRCGGERIPIGDLFEASGAADEHLVLEGDLSRFDGVGARMTGGEIEGRGDVGGWAGAQMAGGVLRSSGDAGHPVRAAYRGATGGRAGGALGASAVAGEGAGAAVARGWVAVGGRTGGGAGRRMVAGTVIALGGIGGEAGLGTRRGSLVSGRAVEPLPNY